MKTGKYFFAFLCICASFHARAQQDTAINLSDTGFIKQTTLNYLTRLVDSTRKGYHGPIIIAVDKNYQPVDSVRIVLTPADVYEATVDQLKKYITACVTGLSGFARTNSVGTSTPNIMGFKGNTVYYLKEDTYEGAYDKLLFIMRPHYDKPASTKKGIKMNLHSQPH